MRDEEETKGWGKNPIPFCAGLVYENEESTFLFSVWDAEVLEDEQMLIPLKVQDWEGEGERKERGDVTQGRE